MILSVKNTNLSVIALVAAALLGLYLISSSGMKTLGQTYHESAQASQVQATLQHLLGAGLLYNSARGVRYITPTDDRALKTMQQARDEALARMAHLQKIDPVFYRQIQEIWLGYEQAVSELLTLAQAGPMPEGPMRAALAKWRDLKFPLEDRLKAVEAEQKRLSALFEQEMNATAAAVVAAELAAGALIIALLLWSGYRTVSAFKRLEEATAQLAHAQGGDLSHRLDTRGVSEYAQVAAHFNDFLAKTQSVVREALKGTRESASIAGELSATASAIGRQSEAGAKEVATIAQETLAVCTRVSEGAARVLEDSRHLLEAAGTLSASAGQVGDLVGRFEQ
ncbi:MAG: HAMP domain-containing protein, partial [Campylobacterales bacterium]